MKKKMGSLVYFDILQLPHTVISNSEKLTHPTVHKSVEAFRMWFVTRVGFGGPTVNEGGNCIVTL